MSSQRGGRDTPTPSAASGEDSGGGNGDSAGAVAACWPADPRSLLGRRVRRTFAAGVFEGVVRGTRMLPPDSPGRRAPGWAPPEAGAAEPQRIWLVCYPDGDKEELYWSELLPALKEAEKRVRALPAPPAGAHKIVKQEAEPPGPRYKGVSYHAGSGKYRVALSIPGCPRPLGVADTAVEGARMYDDGVRAAGHVVVNFPRLPGEVQAVWREPEEVTLRRAGRLDEADGGGSAPPAATDAAKQAAKPKFKGVYYETSGAYRAAMRAPGGTRQLGYADTAVAAARLYDDGVRAEGGVVVNFPQVPGEVQAVRGEQGHATLRRLGREANGSVPPARSAVKPPRARDPKFKGVYFDAVTGVYRAGTSRDGQTVALGYADTALAAARLYDDAMRALGRAVVNIPRLPGEIQAVHGESDDTTLRRAGLLGVAKGPGGTLPSAKAAMPRPPRDPRGGIAPEARAGGGGGGGVERRSRSGADGSPPRKRIKTETPSREATPVPPAEWPSPAAATPAAPTPAPPARAQQQQQQPASDSSSASAAVRDFLRRIQPPINDIERVVAAVPPRMSMAQLLSAVARDTLPADREAAVHCLASILGIDDASDRLQLLIELQAHARRAV